MYTRKVLFMIKLALVVALVYMVVRTVLIPGHVEKTLAPALTLGRDRVRINETTGPPNLSLEDYGEIIERNPFGTSGPRPGSSEWGGIANSFGFKHLVSEESGLALFGTVAGAPAVARAIIKDLKTDKLDMYRIGQKVADARIEGIGTDAVILAHNGEKKILRLNIAPSGSNDNTQAYSFRTTNEKSSTAGADFSTKKTDIDIRTKPTCIEAILKKAVIEPYAVGDQIEGFRITGIENIKEAKDLGLKNGDIIRVVNGHRLTDKQKAYQVFKKAMSQAAINLELLRDNETKKLSFALR